jgi:hypothetical protein
MSQSQNNIVNFQDAAKQKWEEDFKQRWIAKGAGDYTAGIWDWEALLKDEGWQVDIYNNKIVEFSTLVDFDNKILLNRNPKAYHAHHAMKAALDMKFNGGTGRWLFYWQEVHDEAHRHIRDGDEYKDSEYYMTEWYSMELYSRELNPEEEFPVEEDV